MRLRGALGEAKIVDFHVHAFPDAVAERAMRALLAAYAGATPVMDGSLSALLRHMDGAGVYRAVVQPVATKPSQVRSINDWAAAQTDPRIICFGGMHADYDDIQDEIDRIVALGIPGVKIQGNWQEVHIDDPRMYRIYDAARGRLIIMFHSGKELGPVKVMRAAPRQLASIHADFPGLTMICAHMGGYLMWDEVDEFLVGKDVYFDTSACSPDVLDDARFLGMIRRHGAEKILFATDLPFGDPLDDIPRLLSIGLTDTELERIFHGNAKRLLGDRVE